jgi:4a-hydroxytetrahydrobiopterin dehydratase
MSSDLHTQQCQACEGIGKALNHEQIQLMLPQIDKNWQIAPDIMSIRKVFSFKNYYQTMAFVNALAWIAHQENHHPDLRVSYNQCEVTWSTHALNGLSMNDFICAAKTDKLLIAQK